VPPAEPLQPFIKNIQAVAALEQRAVLERTPFERAAEAVTATAGTVAFVAAHAALVAGWAWMNMRSARPIDPYPFSLLNLFLSLEAIVLTSVVLMTQNRMARVADKRAHLDLQVNLLAEEELTAILQMLHALCRDANVSVDVRADRVAALLKETDIQTLAGALDDALKAETKGQAPGGTTGPT
jgi:uncharacterized membrane protein